MHVYLYVFMDACAHRHTHLHYVAHASMHTKESIWMWCLVYSSVCGGLKDFLNLQTSLLDTPHPLNMYLLCALLCLVTSYPARRGHHLLLMKCKL